MMEPSIMTTERGIGENLLLSIQKSAEREIGRASNINVWHRKSNNSWSVNLYLYVDEHSKKRKAPCDPGQGWDFVSCVEDFRVKFLKAKSEEHQQVFTNLLEYDMFVDEMLNAQRNKVGAIIDEGSPVVEENKSISDDPVLQALEALTQAITKMRK